MPPGHGDLYPAMLGTGSLDSPSRARATSTCSSPTRTTSARRWTSSCSRGLPERRRRSRWSAPRVRTRTRRAATWPSPNATGGLLLREAAQCPDEDEDAFQDISKHRYFNTTNLWIDLEARSRRFEVLRCLHFLGWTRGVTHDADDQEQEDRALAKAIMSQHGSVVPLPMIKNNRPSILKMMTQSRRWGERDASTIITTQVNH